MAPPGTVLSACPVPLQPPDTGTSLSLPFQELAQMQHSLFRGAAGVRLQQYLCVPPPPSAAPGLGRTCPFQAIWQR